MLLLADTGFDGFEALRDAAATGADLLWRVQARRLMPVIHPLPDGTPRRGLDTVARTNSSCKRDAASRRLLLAPSVCPRHRAVNSRRG